MPRGGGTSGGRSVGGFFTNLFEDARDTATGIPLGLWMLGKSAVNDVAHAATLGGVGDQFQLDDVAKGMGDYYWNDSPIGAILQGDIGEAASRTYENPFSSALDAFSVASLGAGSLAKAGVISKPGTSLTMAMPGKPGIEYTKRLSRNPLAAHAQIALTKSQHAKALADPTSKAAGRITRKGYLDAFRKQSREMDEVAGQYGRVSDTLVDTHGELGELASAVKSSGMTIDDAIDGYGRILRGEQKAWYEGSAVTLAARAKQLEKATRTGDPLRGFRSKLRREFNPMTGTGRSTGAGGAFQFGTKEAADTYGVGVSRAKRKDPVAEAQRTRANQLELDEVVEEFTRQYSRGDTGPVDLSGIPESYRSHYQGITHEDLDDIVGGTGLSRDLAGDAFGSGEAGELLDSARDAMERAKVYDLSDEAREALTVKVNTLTANRDQLAQLVDAPELEDWYSHAKTLSRETEDAYRANNSLLYKAAQESDEAALEANRKFVESGRTREWNLLHPDRDVPDYVRERALYRPHKDVDDHVTRVKGIGKTNRTAMSSRKSTGTRFISGLDDPDPRHLLEAYIEQRESGTHNYVRASLAEHATPLTRAEFARKVAAGEDIVNISHDPKLVKQFQAEAKLVRKIGETVDEGTRGAVWDLADEVEAVAKMLDEGGRFKDKQVIAVPRTVFENLRREPAFATSAVGKTLVKATDYWRHAVLSYRAPQWMLNNAVGQAILLAVGAGPARGGRELVRLLKDSELSRAVDDVAGEVSSTAPGVQMTVRGSRKPDELPEGKVARLGERYLRGGEAIGRFNSKWADDPFRKSRFLAYARKDIDALKAAGHATDDADAVRQLAENTDWLDEGIQTTLDDMIDFGSLKPFEKAYLRNIFPFYSWMKGSAKVTARHLRDKPTQAQQATAMSDTALDQQEERYGALPSFMQGAIPVPEMFQNDTGTRMVSTAGMNPFMSPVDTASALGQFAPFVGLPETYGGESLIAQMNPFLKAPIAAATGKDPFYGGNLSGKPMIPFLPFTMDNRGEYMINQLTGIPQTKLVGDLTSDPVPTSMYDREAWHSLLQFFGGLPVKDMRLGQAHARALQEQSNDGAVNKG